MIKVKGIVFDVDNSVYPQAGWVDDSVAYVFRKLTSIIPTGPATGKNTDHCLGLAAGMGRKAWDFIIAESGAVFLYLIDGGPPPVFKDHNVCDISDLSKFKAAICLDENLCQFQNGHGEITYWAELKRKILTMYPPDKDFSVSQRWGEDFKSIADRAGLRLKIQVHSDAGIDIMPENISKKIGIEKICEILGIKPEEILVVVDGINDLEMTDGTEVIVVSNACSELKLRAAERGWFVATQPEGEGFLQGLSFFASKGFFGEKSGEVLRIVKESERFKFV
ncbi:MAG: HAD family hydrolase [Patescibacteria group bacterium]